MNRWKWVGSWHFYLKSGDFVLHQVFFFFWFCCRTCLASQADGLTMSHLFCRLWCTEQSPAKWQNLCHACIDHTISRNTRAHTHAPNLLPWQHLSLMHEHTHTHTGGRWGSGLNVYAAFWATSHPCSHVGVIRQHSQTWACVNCQLEAWTTNILFHYTNNQHCMYHIVSFYILIRKWTTSCFFFLLCSHSVEWHVEQTHAGALWHRQLTSVWCTEVCIKPFGSCII